MPDDLVARLLAGDRLALARLLTQVENDTPAGRAALERLFAHTGRAHIIGVTGSPGTGKSSLVNQLARGFRKTDRKVGVLAVDPSSPFSGGALLGDRVRMRDAFGDPGIFIRSMASRGALGGLARATAAAAQVMDAAGCDLVLIETVGAGQSEVDIARLAHTTLVVEAPGMGDDIQAIKAGILEIADILVVNKADRPGVENTERALKSMLELGRVLAGKHSLSAATAPAGSVEDDGAGWAVPVMRAVSTEGHGIEELVQAIDRHGAYLKASGEWSARDQNRLRAEFDHLLRETLYQRWLASHAGQHYESTLRDLSERRISPLQAIAALLPKDEKHSGE